MRAQTARRLGALAWGACALALVLPATASAAEEETHFFNAALSLTGNCSKSSTDPVEDPGCPGGTHPSEPFRMPRGVAIDAYGDRYVSSYGEEEEKYFQGRVDVFGPDGNFLTEIAVPYGPIALAVDSEGNLYVVEKHSGPTGRGRIGHYKPTVYKPELGEVAYDEAPVILAENVGLSFEQQFNEIPYKLYGLDRSTGIAIDPADDHLFIGTESRIAEFSSTAEGTKLLDATIGEGVLQFSKSIAIDAVHKRIYASSSSNDFLSSWVEVFDLENHTHLLKIDGATTPQGKFLSAEGKLPLADDESTGDVFVGDIQKAKKVYELGEDGSYVSTIEDTGVKKGLQYVSLSQIAVDNGPKSPRSGYLYVPSGESGIGHSFAFEPKSVLKAPVVESASVSGVTEAEAVLRATVNPEGVPASYRFEYTTEQSFKAEGFAGALTAGEGTIGAAGEGVAVSVNLAGLAPGTAYRFRVLAHSEGGDGEGQAAFAAYGSPDVSSNCLNEALRAGASAQLPDCRAYELVTPSDTGGHPPVGVGRLGSYFATTQASPGGGKLSFDTEGGPIPGYEGTGALGGDPYLATRTEQGWVTTSTGPDGTETTGTLLGGISSDQGYSFWTAEEEGTAVLGGTATYVRYPDGHSELIGRGSEGTDPGAIGRLITPGGGHIVFESEVPLEPGAPEAGTLGLYDLTADGVTHLVSLLPDESTPAAGQDVTFDGASEDGSAIAFRIAPTLYVRFGDTESVELGVGAHFAGASSDGSRVFYFKAGNLFAYDAATKTTTQFTTSGDVIPVNVSANGSRAYFISPSELPVEANPHGDLPQVGEENLYVSDEGAIEFVGTVAAGDLGLHIEEGLVGGLDKWLEAVGYMGGPPGQMGLVTSRVSADGRVLLFSSRAKLTGYDPEGHPEIYRFDAAAGTLDCLSCVPTGARAMGRASLESLVKQLGEPQPFSTYAFVANLRPDGRRAFFQSTEPLVLADTDNLQDVYEWEEQGVGSCQTEGGCVYLISSGRSALINYLYAVSESGEDVFIRTSDLLLPSLDPDETPSVYDARVNGGFPAPPAPPGECLGEACQPAAGAPGEPMLGSFVLQGQGNVHPAPPKKKHRQKSHHKKTHKRTNHKRRTTR